MNGILASETGGRLFVPPLPGILTGTFGSVAEMHGHGCRYNRTVTQTWVNNTIYYWWFPLYQRATITSLGFAIRANAGGAAKKTSIGVYSQEADLPRDLMGSTGSVTTLSGASIGDNGVYTAVNIPLDPGHYWLSFVTDTAFDGTNWSLDMYQDNATSEVAGLTTLRNTGTFSSSTQNNFPPMASEARAWSDAVPSPLQANATRLYPSAGGLQISVIMGF